MTKDELEKYARDNRKRLVEQVVKLGDVVEVLVGQFAGEKGVIVGIIACGNDYTDPYYEVDMACEVPDKYKCRKALITPNNVVGGFSACEFIVCGNRAPEKPTPEIKVGDIVKIKDDAPDKGWSVETINVNPNRYKFLPFEVVQIEKMELKTMAYADSLDGFMHICIPICYLEPYYSAEDVRRIEEDLQREKEQHLREHSGKETDNLVKDITDVVEEYRKGFAKIASELAEDNWQHYRAELAKELALKIIGANEIRCLQNANLITDFATRIVDNLKKQSE